MADESSTSADTVEESTNSAADMADDTSADRGLEERLGQVELDSR